MGCTSSSPMVQASAAACGLDLRSESQRQNMRAREKFDLQQQRASLGMPNIVRKDLSAGVQQSYKVKNSIQLIFVAQILSPLIQNSNMCSIIQIEELMHGISSRQIEIPSESSDDQDVAATDETSYCRYLAESMLQGKKNLTDKKLTLNTFLEILKVFEQLNIQEANWSKDSKQNQRDWFMRFSRVLLNQVLSLKPYVEVIQQATKLTQTQIVDIEDCLFAVIVFTIRFIQGVNWGYSEQLPHSELDQETYQALKVNFNVIQKFKQTFLRDQEIGQQIHNIEQIAGNSHSHELFLSVHSFQAIENLITYNSVTNDTKCKFPERLPVNDWSSPYQTNAVYRQFYRKFKNQLYDWLCESQTWQDDETYSDVDIYALQQILQLNERTYNTSYLHQLRTASDGKINKKNSKSQFKIDNSNLIYALQADSWESQIIFESFIAEQNHQKLSAETKFQCLLYHACLKGNRITCDTYYILKHIVFQLSQVKAIHDFLLLQPDDEFKEFTTVQNEQNIQIADAHTFIAFLKVIRQVKIDYNIAIFLHGLENVYNQNDLDNFVFILRAASHVMPTYLRFVFSLERRVNNFSKIDKTTKLLMTKTKSMVLDQEYWDTESKDLIESQKVNINVVLASKRNYKTLCKLIAVADPNFENSFLEVLQPEDMLKSFYASFSHIEEDISIMTILYGPVEAKILKRTSALVINDEDQLFTNYVLMFKDKSDNKTYLVLIDKVIVLKSLPASVTSYDAKELMFSRLFINMIETRFDKLQQASEYWNHSVPKVPYLQTYYYKHMKRLQKFTQPPDSLEVHGQLLWFRSFRRLIKYYQNNFLMEKMKSQHILLHLRLIGQVLQGDDYFSYSDFNTQLKGRIGTNEKYSNNEYLPNSDNRPFFVPMHQSLNESQRLEHLIQFPPSQILACRFLSDNNQRAVFSLSCGLCLLIDTVDLIVEKVFVNSSACLDLIKVVEDRFLILAGLSDKVRVFNLDTEKLFFTFQPHNDLSQVNLMQVHQSMFYSYSSGQIVKWDLKLRKQIAQVETKPHPVLKMKLRHNGLITCQKKKGNFIIMYDLDLQLMFQTSLSFIPQDVKKFLTISKSQCLVYSNDGSIVVLNTEYMLEVLRKGSIFSLKSEDCIDILLIKSKDSYMFTIEQHKMDFFTIAGFKRSDSWDYFFPRPIVGCGKNRVGSKICVWDSSSTLSLFNFIKRSDSTKQIHKLPPMHKKNDQILCIDFSTQNILTCSLDRELKVWGKNGKFLKKYDLTSFTNETIISMKMTQDGLFLGSKDMNIYLIDIIQGKLLTVYEGHWSKINLINQGHDEHTIITVSESNIKVWDINLDVCLKNMNEHKGLIVFCELKPFSSSTVITISQIHEYKEWLHKSGFVTISKTLNLPQDSLIVQVCLNDEGDQAYIALDSHQVVVYDLSSERVIYCLQTYRQEDVIYIQALFTETTDYLLIVTRTACVCYLIGEYALERIAAYTINASKSDKYQTQSKYSYQVRFYFTSCHLQLQKETIQDKHTFNDQNFVTYQKQQDQQIKKNCLTRPKTVKFEEPNLDDYKLDESGDEDKLPNNNQEERQPLQDNYPENGTQPDQINLIDQEILKQRLQINETEGRRIQSPDNVYRKQFFIEYFEYYKFGSNTVPQEIEPGVGIDDMPIQDFIEKQAKFEQKYSEPELQAVKERIKALQEAKQQLIEETKIKSRIGYTVLLGDSRGVLHMVNLYLD